MQPMHVAGTSFAALVALFASPVAAQCPNAIFVGLGVLPGGSASQANAVSADGTVVVGNAYFGGAIRAFRWVNAAMQDLGTLPGDAESTAQDVSADGLSVIGASSVPGSNSRAFRWRGGVMELVTGVSASSAFARGVSGDGEIVVGNSNGGAFRWSASLGGVGFGCPPCLSSAMAISADGAVIVGMGSGVNGLSLWRWTQNGIAGFQNPGGSPVIIGVSDDGQVAVGALDNLSEAALWRSNGSVERLGIPPSSQSQIAVSASHDGKVIVGIAANRPFVWTEALGALDLETVLLLYGANLIGWQLPSNNGVYISSDGTTIVGSSWRQGLPSGLRLEAWRASLPLLLAEAPKSGVMCAGAAHVLTTRMVGTAAPFQFTWRKNGVAISGDPRLLIQTASNGLSSTMTILSAMPGDEGVYDCIATSEAHVCRTVTTPAVSLAMCYANCDCSTTSPRLTPNDFQCYINLFASGNTAANCDGSTNAPVLSPNDFLCFVNSFAAGCS